MKNVNMRRSFIGKVLTVIVGSLTLNACVNDKKEENEGSEEKMSDSSYENKIPENLKMPRDLVMKMLDQKVDRYMNISYNCAQSSFLALEKQFGLKGGSILKALTPLTGIAERGETCGAVTGPLMALGLIYGRGENRLGDWDTYRESLVPTGKFCDLFVKEFGSTMCSDIQKKRFGKCYRLTDPEELEKFQEADATTQCSAVVRKGVQVAANIILDGAKV